MAALHAAVLARIGVDVTVVATSPTRVEPLAEKYNMRVYAKGLASAIDELRRPDAAIVALPVDKLAAAATSLAATGIKRILLEKPGCLTATEMEGVVEAAERSGSLVVIAYNRRFFASVIEARRRIAAADRILSVSFEFCEDADRVAALPTASHIKENWVLANSSHVIDLAFHLCGEPSRWSQETTGSLDWHSRGADFRGLGETELGARFSYFADWRGPGRWGIEIVLPNERLILRPMEKLAVMPRGSFEALPVEIDDTLDREFKAGLYLQLMGFLDTDIDANLPTAQQKLLSIRNVYNRIANYKDGAG
ncbi:putative dehydrogenase [Rhizobium sp. PvP099]|nr:putative dehydrogenase [Rhizobium sp. PvP099]